MYNWCETDIKYVIGLGSNMRGTSVSQSRAFNNVNSDPLCLICHKNQQCGEWRLQQGKINSYNQMGQTMKASSEKQWIPNNVMF